MCHRLHLIVIALFIMLSGRLAGAQTSSPRIMVSLGADWKFLRSDAPDAANPAFDDSAWQAVTVPHTWNNLDGQDGGNNYRRGPSWYRRHLTITPELSGKSLFLKFNGAATVTQVYVNGKLAGTHAGNFAAFCFDITSLVSPGDNLLAVRVDNSLNLDVTPVSGDFTIFGGLYRDISLLALDPLSITPLDDASPGVYLTQTRVSAQQAVIDARIKLRNGGGAEKTAAVTTLLLDAQGQELQRLNTNQAVAARSNADATQRLTIANPHLWNGVKDPYLYQIVTEIRDGDRVTDRLTQPLGLRFFSVDPNRGFLLNGQPYNLHGVNRHQDRLDKGWAISRADHEQDFGLIREMGCNAVRLAHYQHDDYAYELCDKSGLAVWAELSIVDRLGPNNNSHPTAAYRENARQQLTELIKQNYNHPSIFMWSLYNEIRLEQTTITPGPRIWDIVGELNALSHELDPSRLTVCASLQKPDHPANFLTDILAINWYYGWYGGSPSDWGRALDGVHAALPTRCLAISEYGAGASILQHQIPPTQPNPGGPWHPEEWQSHLHEQAYLAMKTRPWLWGTFLWNMFDFAVDSRREGDTPGRNDKGLVTYDRKTKKDAFYFYQAQWTSEPMVHVTSARFTPRPLQNAPLKIYSNGDSVELFLNGQSLGTKAGDNGIFVWDNATLKQGDNTLEAVATKAGKQVRDTCQITYDPNTPATRPYTGPVGGSLSAPPLPSTQPK